VKRSGWLIVIVAGLCSVAAYIRFVHDPYVRRVAQLERQRDSLDRAVRQLSADSVRQAARDRVLADSVGTLLRLSRRQTVRVDTLRQDADSLAAVVLEAAADSLRPKIKAALAAKDSVIGILLIQRGELTQVIDLQGQQLALRDTALASTRAALAEALVQRDRWRKVARPPLVLRLLRDLPKVAVGVAIGVVVAN